MWQLTEFAQRQKRHQDLMEYPTICGLSYIDWTNPRLLVAVFNTALKRGVSLTRCCIRLTKLQMIATNAEIPYQSTSFFLTNLFKKRQLKMRIVFKNSYQLLVFVFWISRFFLLLFLLFIQFSEKYQRISQYSKYISIFQRH